jgi:predicted phage terminase large subunit-like protein
MYDFTTPIDEEARNQELSRLLDPEEYKKRRKASEDMAGKWGIEEYNKLRHLAKTDTFFLAHTVLDYTKLSTNLHGDVCKWIKDTEKERFRLLLLPRGHYKSTIYTISNSIQACLTNDDNSNVWPYCLGTDIRICLMHEVAGVASKFLAEIQNHFLANEFLMALFPECIPDIKKHTINMIQLELPRKSFWKEKTFEIMGTTGRYQGVHYNILKPDDLMGKEGKDSKIILQSTKDIIDNLQSFLTSFEDPDHIDFTGTHWSHDDIYFHIQERYEGQLALYKRAIEEKGKDGVLRSIFPEEYPSIRLEILKKNKEIFSAQYMNDPDASGGDLDITKLRYYYWRNKESFVAFDNRVEDKITFYNRELDKVLLVDPAMSGKLGMCVTGTDRRNRNFVLETIKKPFTTPNFITEVFRLVMKWQIRAVVVESVLFSELYEHIFMLEMGKRGIRFRIIMVPVPRRIDKDRRIIDSLSPYLEDGTLYVNEEQKELIQEFKRIGFTQDVHTVDALAMGPKVWKPFDGSSVQDSFGNNQNNYSVTIERDPTDQRQHQSDRSTTE